MKKVLCLLSILFVVLMGFVNSFAQTNPKTESGETYKIHTYTIVGSNDSAGKTKLPSNLSKAFEDVKNNFTYSNYELLSTQFQLIKRRGSISYKSIIKNLEFSDKSNLPIFADWGYQGLSEEMVKGRKQVGFKSFRFSMRFPLKTSIIGKNNEIKSSTVYEKLGLTAQNLDFPIGQSVVFASFPIEISDKTLFFAVHLEPMR